MKKLIALAAIATCGAALAVASANIVGYQYVTVISGTSLFTPTFKNVDASGFNLADIQPRKSDTEPFGTAGATRCNGVIKINKISAEGNYTATYSYYETPSRLGWYNDSGVQVTADNPVLFTDGEAMLVDNQYKNQTVTFQVSGAVDLVNKNLVPTGVSLFGNNTPVGINLANVTVLNKEGEPFGTAGATRCNGVIKVNKISAEGNYTDTYSYYETPARLGWYTDAGVQITKDNPVSLLAGEAFLVDNQYKGQAIYFKLPSPVGE